ncbi:MAG: hypothetical protein ACLPXZ_09125 [Mycobacterium sp.]
MTPPQYPYFPPHPVGPAFRPAQAPKRTRPIDIIVTLVISAFAVVAAFRSFWFLLGRTSDKGVPGLGWAYLVTCGGIAVAALIAVVGVLVAATRGRVMWIWPTVALGLIVVAAAGGLEIFTTASK